MARRGTDWGSALGMLLGGVLLIVALNEVATNPRISPLWRKIAQTAEGDVYRHIVNGAVVTILA